MIRKNRPAKIKAAKHDYGFLIDQFVDVELIKGHRKVLWEYIGEGFDGDYNENDPKDIPLLRFSCFKLNTNYNPSDYLSCKWIALDDSSYCTRLPVGTSVHVLAKAAAIIMEAIENISYKRRLEELSWFCPEDFKRKLTSGY